MDRQHFPRGWRRLVLAFVLAAVSAMAAPQGARASDSPACPKSPLAGYSMSAAALTGPTSTDLAVTLTPAPGCAAVTTVQHVVITTFTETGRIAGIVYRHDVQAHDGTASIALKRVERGRRIEVDALLVAGTPRRTYVARDATRSRLRPDLTVAAVHAPLQTLTTRPVDVVADIAELAGDTGATAHVTLAGTIGPLAGPIDVTVPAGGHVDVTFPGVSLASPASVELNVLVTEVAPEESDATNDARSTTVEVTRNELAPSRMLVESLGGYGFQLNHHLYAPITNPPPETLPDLQAKVIALEPQLVRIFYSENWEANADRTHPEWAENLDSFKRVVELANDSGATIVIAYQSAATAKTQPVVWMTRFADVLQDLIVTRGLTNVRWATIGNEPNTINSAGNPSISLPQYEALYRALDAQLVARGLRDRVGLIGGDVVQNTEDTPNGHRGWFDYMVTHMNDVVNAWSEHIYWWYDIPTRMEERLKDVAYLVHQELPEAARKPTFLMEYGVRGYTSCATKPDLKNAYYLDADCTDLRRMPLAGFHKLAFAIESAQLGFDGAANWDLYWSTYDRTKANQSFWMIGPPEEGWALYPSYYAFQLLLQTTSRGWHVLGVDPWTDDDAAEPISGQVADPPTWVWDQREQELTSYEGPDGQLTIVGLDTNGRSLVAPNGESSSYSVGGLPPNTTFTLVLWNANGDGKNTVAETITTGAAGVARFDVPLQAAFVLTTVPVS